MRKYLKQGLLQVASCGRNAADLKRIRPVIFKCFHYEGVVNMTLDRDLQSVQEVRNLVAQAKKAAAQLAE